MKKTLILLLAALLLSSCGSNDKSDQTTTAPVTITDDGFAPAPAPTGSLPSLTEKTPSTNTPEVEEVPLTDLSAFEGTFGVSSGGRLMTFVSDGVDGTLTFRTDTGVETVSGVLDATDKTLTIGDTSYAYAFWNGMLLLNQDDQPYILQKDDTVAAPLLTLLSGSYAGDGLTVTGKDGILTVTVDGIDVSGVPSIESVGKVTLTAAESVNLTLNADATASTVETGGREAAAAIDGDIGTRWSSEYKDDQSLTLDLGSLQTVGTVRIYWETAAGKDYDILLSADGENWKNVAAVKSNSTANEWLTYEFEPQSARYVKMDGHTRVGEYGFSIYEMEVYHRYVPALSFTCTADANGIALTLNGTTYHLKEAN
ncbi:MAG: discoidin domain-containing protein [Clostridia bacterium]|nr:discoidin domain-containing protein [Clostridia bacterium]